MVKKILFLAVVALLLFSSANAILNTKTYDTDTKTIIVKDYLGLSAYLKLKLISNTEQCLSNDCEAVLKLTPAQDMKPDEAIAKAIKFIDRGGYDISGKVTYSILVEQTTTEKVKTPIYGQCEEDVKYTDDETKAADKAGIKLNKTRVWQCEKDSKESEVKHTDLISLYDFGTLKAKTDYTIHIKGTKPVNVFVDWQMVVGGMQAKEFAWWSSNWTKKKDLLITNPDATARNKEVFIYYLNDTEINAQANAMYSDIRIVNDTDGFVPFQLIYYRNNQTADAVLWVGDYIEASTSVNYSIYYNNTASTGANSTIFTKYDFFETNLMEFVDNSGGVWTGYDTWSKLYGVTAQPKDYQLATSQQSLAFNDRDGTIDSTYSIPHDFKASWWQNPLAQYTYYSGAGNGGWTLKSDASGNMLIGIEGGATSDSGCDMNGLNRWYWLKVEVNATGHFYWFERSDGICQASNTAGHSGGWNNAHLGRTSGGSTEGADAYDNLLISDVSGFDWQEYITPSSIIVSPEQSYVASNVLAVTLLSPANTYKTRDTTTLFNCSATAGTGNTLKNATFYIYAAGGGITSYFEAIAGDPTQYQLNRTQPFSANGVHKWNCLFEDSTGLAWATNRTFTIDNVAPVVNVIAPVNGTTYTTWYVPLNVTLNATSTDATIGIDACWWNYTSKNVYPCNIAQGINFTSGNYQVYFYANDTLGNTNTGNGTSFTIIYVNETAEYTTPISEDAPNVISMNITADILTSLSGTLWYNGTAYATTSNLFSATAGSLSTNIPIAPISFTQTRYFYWNYTINGIGHLSNNYTQNIVAITPPTIFDGDCGALSLNTSHFYYFSDEINMSVMNGVDIAYNYVYGILNASGKVINGTLFGVNNLTICINGSLGNYTISYGEIQYHKTGYTDRRYYTFSGVQFTPELVGHELFALASGYATSFLYTFQDNILQPYTSKYAALLRWYPGLNDYKIVDMGKTDGKGQTIMRVYVENVDYRVALYHVNGELIKLAEPVRFACLDSPCSYTMTVSHSETNLYEVYGIQNSLTFNTTSKYIRYIWNDPSQHTSQMNLLVTKLTGDNEVMVCNATSISYTGALGCDLSAYSSGIFTANVWRSASDPKPIQTKTFEIDDSVLFKKAFGLFISLIIYLALVFVGIYNPYAALMMSILAMIPAVVLHVFPYQIIILVAVMTFIAAHVIKKVS